MNTVIHYIALTFLLGMAVGLCPRACILDPEVTEGPYYVDLQYLRVDIRENKAGIPLYLNISVIDYNTCATVADAGVEIWHCAADGVYSHFEEASEGISNPQTDDTTYLRGIQLSDASGSSSFLTIYPGWYQGRALHIHMKVHINGTEGTVVHTGQLFFEEDLNALVEEVEPYASRTVERLANADDGIYNNGGYYGLIENTQYVDESDISQGIIASITVGIDSGYVASNTESTVSNSNSTVDATTESTVSNSDSTVDDTTDANTESNSGSRILWTTLFLIAFALF